MLRRNRRFLLLVCSFLWACAPVQTAPPADRVPVPALAPDTTAVDRDPISHSEYASRRAELAQRVGDGLVVVFGSPEPVADYLEFVQNSDYRYLTGINEPGSRLLLTVRGGAANGVLFVRERSFEREVWEGYRLGTQRATENTGIPARPTEDFPRVLDSLLAGTARVFIIDGADVPPAYLSPGQQLIGDLRSRPNLSVSVSNGLVWELRARKSSAELALIERAIDITVRAHAAVAQTVAPGRYEYEVEAALEHAFRASGAERTAFASIVGSGPNSTVLHYNTNDRRMQAGEVVVVDIGASWRGYSGDVTRTYPVSGRFTPEQREIYQIVRDAQAAAERAAVLGGSASALAPAAERVLAEGLARLGLIDAADATYDCETGPDGCRQLQLYYMHSLGHGIGLDVHDPGTAPNEMSENEKLAPGDAFSIEPGIYVRRRLLEVIPNTARNAQLKERIRSAVERYADIGVRIEDDYLVTPAGVRWISRAPREIGEIETR